MKKTSYCKCFPELDDKELDEKYALISHAIQLENKPEAKNYIDILKKNGININLYPTKKIFNEQNKKMIYKEMLYISVTDLKAICNNNRITVSYTHLTLPTNSLV